MTELTDEYIMAYVDGELPEKEADDVRKAIEKDPRALKRVEVFKDSTAMLQGVYDAPLNEAVPEQLIRTIRNHQENQTPRRIGDFLAAFLRLPQWSPAYGLALLVMLLLGISAGTIVSRWTLPSNGPNTMIFSGEKFSRGLETTLSGQSFALAGTIDVMPVATFLDKTDRYCRQYEARSRGSKKTDLSRGIACRAPSGQWQAWIHMPPRPSDMRQPQNNTGYIPAAGSDDLLDDVMEKTMAAPPLTLDQEEALIDQAWR